MTPTTDTSSQQATGQSNTPPPASPPSGGGSEGSGGGYGGLIMSQKESRQLELFIDTLILKQELMNNQMQPFQIYYGIINSR